MAGVEYHGKIFYAENGINAFCSYDLDTKQVQFIDIFANEDLKGELFCDVVLYKDSIWFIPAMATHIVCVDLKTQSMRYFDIPYYQKSWQEDDYHRVYSETVMISNRFLYCLPYDIDTLLVIDLETMEFTPIYDVQQCCDKKHSLTGGYKWKDEFLLFYSNCSNYKSIGIRSNEWINKKYTFSKIGKYYSPVMFDNKICMIDGISNEIIVFSPGEQEKRIEIPTENNAYYGYMTFGKDILYFPFKADNFLLFHADIEKVEMIDYEGLKGAEVLFTDTENEMHLIMSDCGKRLITSGVTNCVLEFDNIENPKIYSLDFDKKAFFKKYIEMCSKKEKLQNKRSIIKEMRSNQDSLSRFVFEQDFEVWLSYGEMF